MPWRIREVSELKKSTLIAGLVAESRERIPKFSSPAQFGHSQTNCFGSTDLDAVLLLKCQLSIFRISQDTIPARCSTPSTERQAFGRHLNGIRMRCRYGTRFAIKLNRHHGSLWPIGFVDLREVPIENFSELIEIIRIPALYLVTIRPTHQSLKRPN